MADALPLTDCLFLPQKHQFEALERKHISGTYETEVLTVRQLTKLQHYSFLAASVLKYKTCVEVEKRQFPKSSLEGDCKSQGNLLTFIVVAI